MSRRHLGTCALLLLAVAFGAGCGHPHNPSKPSKELTESDVDQ